jgi:hypothetical protein
VPIGAVYFCVLIILSGAYFNGEVDVEASISYRVYGSTSDVRPARAPSARLRAVR